VKLVADEGRPPVAREQELAELRVRTGQGHDEVERLVCKLGVLCTGTKLGVYWARQAGLWVPATLSHPLSHPVPAGKANRRVNRVLPRRRPQAGLILRGYAGRVEVVCQLLESVVGGLYPVYPHDGDQVPFDLVQHPVRADAQPAVGAADERARRRPDRQLRLPRRG
jgi:hypothetical protein